MVLLCGTVKYAEQGGSNNSVDVTLVQSKESFQSSFVVLIIFNIFCGVKKVKLLILGKCHDKKQEMTLDKLSFILKLHTEVSVLQFKKSKCLGLAKKNASLTFTIHHPDLLMHKFLINMQQLQLGYTLS